MSKKIILSFVTIVLLAWWGMAQGSSGQQTHPENPVAMADSNAINTENMWRSAGLAINMQRNTVVLLPSPDGDRIVIIDSIDNCIDVVLRTQDTLVRIGHYLVDTAHGRHDVANIIRPKSIEVMGNNIFFCASANNDIGRVGVLTLAKDTLVASHVVNLPCHAQFLDVQEQELVVVGTNVQGYDINIFRIEDNGNGLKLVPRQSHLYHVPKQSERIQASDPAGVGISVVAIVVVFLALVCITLIFGGNAKSIKWAQDRRARRAAIKAGVSAEAVQKPSDTTGEVYAAIAAAIFMYQEDMHDEEHAILTISKVERAWTPWNAKFYNMNQYFNTRTSTKK